MGTIDKARSKIPVSKMGGQRVAAQPTIVFTRDSDRAYVSEWTLSLLKGLMAKAGVKRVYVTSTYRSPNHQARVMLRNLKPKKTMYAGHGARVENVARSIVEQDKLATSLAESISQLPGVGKTGYTARSSDEIVRAMADEIERLESLHGSGCVSRHQLKPARVNVLDIASKAIAPDDALEEFIRVLTRSSLINRIGLPKGSKATSSKHFVETQPCIHLEIAQPTENLRRTDNIV